jgi:hypothetical protein
LPLRLMCWCWDDPQAARHRQPVAKGTERVRAMSTLDFSVLLAGSIMLVGGLIAVVVRELGTHPERRLVGPIRDAVEVLFPLVGAVVLVVSVWISVS